MPDGAELAAVIIRPDHEGRFPAIMSYSPYRRITLIQSQPTEEDFDLYAHGASYFAQRGYAVIHYDVRGTGNSGGSSQDVYADKERKDGYEMVEWIAAQVWCDGNVGMWGKSYHGVVQWQVAVQNPPHLKALIVGSANDDVYRDWTYPGGALRPYMFDTYSPLMTAWNFAPPDIEVVGEKWSEIWQQHLENNSPWGIGYISHPLRDSYWTDRSLQPDYSRVKVPTLVYSGWADCYPTQMLRAYSNLKVPKKALIGPWGHYWPESAFPGPRVDARPIWLQWFDHWLKDMDNGVMDEPPITLWVKGYKEPDVRMYDEEAGSWRYEQEWPLARTQATAMYFHPEGKLSSESPANAEQQDQYPYKPSVGITAGMYWGGGILPFGMPIDQKVDEAYSLGYSSPLLNEDTEMTGDPKAVLYVSTTADTAYFHVKIVDVAPDGTAKWVNDGGLNATHRNSDAHPEPMKPGEIYELELDLKSVAYTFPRGHRIRIDIASADFQNAWPTAKSGTISIHRSRKYPSRIVLPLVSSGTSKLPEPSLKPWLYAMPEREKVPKPTYEIIQDLINRTTTVRLGAKGATRGNDGVTEMSHVLDSSYTVSDSDPADTVLKSRCCYTVKRPGIDNITVEANEVVASDVNSFCYVSQVHITVNEKPYFDKSWTVSIPRQLN